MLHKIDRYIIFRLFTITIFVLVVLIFIYIIIDFSQNSDQFTSHGATIEQVLGIYYLNYIPEMTRLVTPVAVFIACLLVTGQMADRLEIVSLKAAGISFYRLLIPYLIFAFLSAIVISYLDGFVVPISNAKRIAFERTYLNKQADRIDNNLIFRQDSRHSLVMINYFDPRDKVAYKVRFFKFNGDNITESLDLIRMEWLKKKHVWQMITGERRIYTSKGYKTEKFSKRDTTLNLFPRDLARTTTDVSQLTYPEIVNYIHSLEISGAGDIDLPKVQFYDRLSYPFSIIIVTFIGLALAYEKRKAGHGVLIAYGLAICFLYLAFMMMVEPFGSTGEIPPLAASLSPHVFFFLVGLWLIYSTRK